MTNDQIFLNGKPVVGFGDASVGDDSGKPIAGLFIGAISGAVLGALVGKGIGTAVGAVVGGIGGTIVGASVAKAQPSTPATAPTTASSWKQIQQLAGLKAGQQLAIAIAGPNGAPLLPADIAQLDLLIATLPASPANLPTGNFVKYPPGSKLPSDWPADDDLGAGAYRVVEDVLADAPAGAKLVQLAPSVGVAKIWVRDKR